MLPRLTAIVSFAMIVSLCAGCAPPSMEREIVRTGVIDADDPYIQYVGRFDFSNPKSVVFDWAGVFIVARFEGSSCAIRLHDGANEYAVIIDDHAPRLLTTDSSTSIYPLAVGLQASVSHTVMIQKRTEPLVGRGEFSGFVLDKGRSLLPPDPRPLRRIEFIGNSITSGYGDEGKNSDCHFSPQTENACMSFAAISARALNADYSLISYSGRGAVRNYGDSLKTSAVPMPALYDRTCCFDSADTWDFSRWIPQAVVINLGTNDFSTKPYPDSTVFQTAYSALIDRVRSLYPGVTVFCINGPMIEEPCRHLVREVVERQSARSGRNQDVFFVDIRKELFREEDWGCDRHPNVIGMSKMADVLVPAMRLRMNW